MNFQDRKLIPSKYIYLFMSFICFLLLFVSVVFGDRFSPLKAVASAIVTPMQSGINKVGTKMYNDVIEKKSKEELEKENEELSAQLEEALAQIQLYEQEDYELKRLQELLQLKEQYTDYDMVGARVIATDSTNWFHTFIINKGTADGIEVGCNVLAGNGLAGIVTEVGTNYSKVRAIIDENSHISASVSGTDTLCTVSGDLSLIKEGYIKVGYINKEDVIEEEKKESKKDVIEEMEEPHTNTSKVSILRKRSTGSMTLNELRESLGLTKLRGEMDSNSEKKLQEELMTEISESTTRIRHIGSKYLALRDKS